MFSLSVAASYLYATSPSAAPALSSLQPIFTTQNISRGNCCKHGIFELLLCVLTEIPSLTCEE